MAEQKEGGLKLLPGLLSELLPAQIAPGLKEHSNHEQQQKEAEERGGSDERSWDEQRWREKQQAQDEQQEGVQRQKADETRATNSSHATSMGEESEGRFGQLLPEKTEAEAMLEGTDELIENQQEHAREEEQSQTEEQQLQEFLRQMDTRSESQTHRLVEDDIQGDMQCTECRSEIRGEKMKPSVGRRAELPVDERATATIHVALRNAKCAFTCAEKTLADLQDLTYMYAQKAGTSPQALGFEEDLLLPPFKTLMPSKPLGAVGGRGLYGLVTNLVSLPAKAAVAAACAVVAANEYTYEVSVDFMEAAARAGGAVLSAAAGLGAAAAGRAAMEGAKPTAKSVMNGPQKMGY
ncbi:hypothetical protein KFL_000170400 [Klebsormidium nitens]|uniref:Uncharacterized protein n=1 Tax=Klebsormidium nitens TaxID=105231 RepID=A0A1Y1HJH3_KLENI|nr:hypothetical protein KFL_000170400 [Klebsormidium nitens]|eukprot:GAQ78694.1 hypothetical protein KFL_000170400 [Klebsormidium nitens]